MSMSNKTYDILKWIAMYLLPAAGYIIFCTGWNLGSPVWRAGSRNHHCG